MGIEDSNLEAKLLSNDSYRLLEIRVVCDKDSGLKVLLIRIMNKMRCEVDVGALLLGSSC